jgi:putative ABC transport system permease protein
VILALALGFLLQAPPPELLVERRLAEAGGIAVGDTVTARALGETGAPVRFTVAGVFERPADPRRLSRNEMEVRLRLPDLEALLPHHDRVDRFAIALAPGADPDSVATWIESLAFGTRVYAAAALADEASATFRVISRFHDAIGAVTVVASGIFLLCVMILRVDARRRDLGVLRLIGVQPGSAFRSVVAEAVAIAVLGTLAGIALGMVLAAGVNAYFGAYYDTALEFARVTPRVVLTAGVLGIILGTGAGALAALRVVCTPPARLGERT